MEQFKLCAWKTVSSCSLVVHDTPCIPWRCSIQRVLHTFFSSFKRFINTVIIECFIVYWALNVARFGSSTQTLARGRPVGFQSGAVEPAERSDMHLLAKTPRRTVTLKSLPPANSWAPAPTLRHAHRLIFLPHNVRRGLAWVLSVHLPSVRLSKCATPEYHITRLRSSAFPSTSKGFSCLCAATAFRVPRLGPPPTSSTLWWEGVTLTSHWLILAWGKAQR